MKWMVLIADNGTPLFYRDSLEDIIADVRSSSALFRDKATRDLYIATPPGHEFYPIDIESIYALATQEPRDEYSTAEWFLITESRLARVRYDISTLLRRGHELEQQANHWREVHELKHKVERWRPRGI
jgi:hypothetical protein